MLTDDPVYAEFRRKVRWLKPGAGPVLISRLALALPKPAVVHPGPMATLMTARQMTPVARMTAP